MIWHSSDKNAVLNYFNVNKLDGLNIEKADIIFNDLTNKKKENNLILLARTFGKTFTKTLNIVLIASVLIMVLISLFTETAIQIPVVIILAVLVLQAICTVIENRFFNKLYHSLDDYKKYSSTVIRNGQEINITSDSVVPGDIIKLKFGDLIPADARLIEANNFRCDEYVLTGEIVYTEKNPDTVVPDISNIKERINMVFAGCSVMSGTALAVVTETGTSTELEKQKINNYYLYNEKKSDMALISKISAYVVGITASIYFLLHLIYTGGSYEQNFAITIVYAVISSVALAIACFPESLPNSISLIKSIGTNKLLEDGTIVLDDHAVKKAASVSVICADKGEVFTTDQYAVSKLFNGKKITDLPANTPDSSDLMLAKLSVICSDGSKNDSTQQAALKFCQDYAGLSAEDAKNLYPALTVIPFDNERKLVTTVNMVNGKPFAIVKGAPEILVPKCIGIDGNTALKINDLMGEEALKVIAVGYKELDEVQAIPNVYDLESDLTFAGFIGFETELSENIVKTVRVLEKASIRTIMITGDNLNTAMALARRAGILHDNLKYITDEELNNMSDEELDREITSYALFARITPANRFRIVKALQHNNEKVAITGSSVFDAPSLRKATVGLALKNDSCDVAKNASDLIINNTGLSSILKTIATCKNIYNNMRSVVNYMLSSNLGELLTEILGLIIFRVPVFLAAQLLLVNLITDIFPTLTIAYTPVDTNSLPRSNSKTFTLQSIAKILIQGFIMAMLSIIGFSIGNKYSIEVGRAVVFATIGFSQMAQIICNQNNEFVFKNNIFKNKHILLSTGVGTALLILVLATPIGSLFGMACIPSNLITTVILLPIIFIICNELIKLGFKLFNKYSKPKTN
ncbi:MAG: cation-transporting P-type ATPase [Clostridia bacterium]|nr:cation-transporting P-type ATPase [Clostridia bacterium]